MTLVNRKQISLYEEAEAGLNSLVKQTAQVGVGLLGMLLLTGGNPPALTVGLSVVGGIAFVAWSEERRLTKFYARQTQLIHDSVIASETLAERSEGKKSQLSSYTKSESLQLIQFDYMGCKMEYPKSRFLVICIVCMIITFCIILLSLR